MKKSIAALVVAAIAVAGFTGIATAQSTASKKNIVQTAVAAGKFETLVSLVKQAGLVGTLSAKGNLTVFAPTDQAFAELKKSNPELFAKIASDKNLLRAVLTYHVVGKRIPAAAATSAAKKGQKVSTVQGERIALSFKKGKIVLNGSARVVIPNVKASNGIIHAIDSVLVPPSLANIDKNIVQAAVAGGTFKTLVSLVEQAGLVGDLSGPGQLTVFAPTDAAFKKVPKATLAALGNDKALLKSVLLYHVAKGKVAAAKVVKLKSVKTLQGGLLTPRVSGKKVFIGKAQVVTPDVMASNGVIHVINRVLIPPTA